MSFFIKESVRIAIAEDVGTGDVTAALCPVEEATAHVICREQAILCGQDWFNETFHQIDDNISITWLCADGNEMTPTQEICIISGNARSILTAERTALNFLQTLSGTATVTHDYVAALKNSSTKILDTRKTIPGLRQAQKYAVLCGGGKNHRIGLYDAFLIKENHIAACGSIKQAIQEARKQQAELTIEVEVETLAQLQQAIDHDADIALLDNFSLEQIKQAVFINDGRIKLEVSGNVELDNVASYAMTGVDYISIGALTKHMRAVDFSMLFIA